MANESIHMPVDQNLDYQMVAHIVEGLKKEHKTFTPLNARLKMHNELRMLTFWRWVSWINELRLDSSPETRAEF